MKWLHILRILKAQILVSWDPLSEISEPGGTVVVIRVFNADLQCRYGYRQWMKYLLLMFASLLGPQIMPTLMYCAMFKTRQNTTRHQVSKKPKMAPVQVRSNQLDSPKTEIRLG